MDAGSVRTIWDAVDRYAVLVFHDRVNGWVAANELVKNYYLGASA